MKKFLSILLSSAVLLVFSQQETNDSMNSQYFNNPTESFPKKTQNAVASGKSSEVMIIDPLTRAADFKEAYQFLKTQKAGTTVSFQLTNDEVLTHVLSFEVMKGGSLVIFKLNTNHGIKYKVVKIENIDSISIDIK